MLCTEIEVNVPAFPTYSLMLTTWTHTGPKHSHELGFSEGVTAVCLLSACVGDRDVEGQVGAHYTVLCPLQPARLVGKVREMQTYTGDLLLLPSLPASGLA